MTPMPKRDARMVSLGYGKFVKADRVYALVPIEPGERGDGRRTYVHVDGLDQPLVASRSERAILADVEAALTEAAGVPRARGGAGRRTRRTSSRGFGLVAPSSGRSGQSAGQSYTRGGLFALRRKSSAAGCANKNLEMESPVFIGAQVPQDLRDAVTAIAREHERSFSAEVRLALKQHVAHLSDEDPRLGNGVFRQDFADAGGEAWTSVTTRQDPLGRGPSGRSL